MLKKKNTNVKIFCPFKNTKTSLYSQIMYINNLLNTETLGLIEFNDPCPAHIDLDHGKVSVLYFTNDSIVTLT